MDHSRENNKNEASISLQSKQTRRIKRGICFGSGSWVTLELSLNIFNYSVNDFVKWACGINNHPVRYIFFDDHQKQKLQKVRITKYGSTKAKQRLCLCKLFLAQEVGLESLSNSLPANRSTYLVGFSHGVGRTDVEPGGIGADHSRDHHLHHVVYVTRPAILARYPRGAVPLDSFARIRVLREVVRVDEEAVLAEPLGVLSDRREIQRASQLSTETLKQRLESRTVDDWGGNGGDDLEPREGVVR
jgi:hypothetical protein